MNRLFLSLFCLLFPSFSIAQTTAAKSAEPIKLVLPNQADSFRFAVLGDTGTGGSRQYQVAQKLTEFRGIFPFEIALMLGDNLYGGEAARDLVNKFSKPYEQLLRAGVKFHAVLGNHDEPAQRLFKDFNMNGQRYYSFRPKADVRFFALDSNYMDKPQLEWLENELRNSTSEWKIAFFHHPVYSSGKTHGSDVALRGILTPLFAKYGVSVVFAGHEHFYERIKPQGGIAYFTSGGGAKVRRGDLRKTDLTVKGYDLDNHFMLCEIVGDKLYFQAISRTGETIDSGVVERRKAPAEKAASAQ